MVEFQTDGVLSFEIFDLNYRRVYGADRKYWDGRDENGNIVPPGVYIYKLDMEHKTIYGSCVVVR